MSTEQAKETLIAKLSQITDLLKRYKNTPPRKIIGCVVGNSVYYCKLNSGMCCGLECGIEHGNFIFSAK